jgi:tetratricopeptide (TPR) repeat protein
MADADTVLVIVITVLFLAVVWWLNAQYTRKPPFFLSGLAFLLFVYSMILYLSCFAPHRIVSAIIEDQEALSRVSRYYQLLEADKSNPLNTNFLSGSLLQSPLPEELSLPNRFRLMISKMGSGFHVLLISGIIWVLVAIRGRQVDRRQWMVAVVAFAGVTLTCTGPLAGEMYVAMAKSALNVKQPRQASDFLEKASRWAPRLKTAPYFLWLAGQVDELQQQYDTTAHAFFRGGQAVREGYYKSAILHYTDAAQKGDVRLAVNDTIADICFKAAMAMQKKKQWSAAQPGWKMMTLYPGGEDGHLYEATNQLLICRDEAPLSEAVCNLEAVLRDLDHRQVRADALVSLGCVYDRQGQRCQAREAFFRSLDTFILAKMINYRAQKALIGF